MSYEIFNVVRLKLKPKVQFDLWECRKKSDGSLLYHIYTPPGWSAFFPTLWPDNYGVVQWFRNGDLIYEFVLNYYPHVIK